MPNIELRTGVPYANLISNQRRFSEAVGSHFGIDPGYVLPTAGTMGAIEAVRNHYLGRNRNSFNTVLTVLPGYWRARESFEGMGFAIIDVKTERNGFTIDESELIKKASEIMPSFLYLSLPNNPTGAIFDPGLIINMLPEVTSVMLDFTLPTTDLDSRALVRRLHAEFSGRKNTFFVGSTSKSHGTAEHRIGWAISCSMDDARALNRENRVVIASFSIEEGIKSLSKPPTALEKISESISILGRGEGPGTFEIVRPLRGSQTSYILVKLNADVDEVKRTFNDRRIFVMWGSDLGLTDEYMRLDLLEPTFVRSFVEALNGGRKRIGLADL